MCALCDTFNVAVDLLASLLEDQNCAVHFALFVFANSVCYVAVTSDKSKFCHTCQSLQSRLSLSLANNFPLWQTNTAAFAPQLTRNKELRKVLRKLHVNLLPDFTPYKRFLISLVCKYIDVFVESDLDVGTTSFTIYKIDTVDTFPMS